MRSEVNEMKRRGVRKELSKNSLNFFLPVWSKLLSREGSVTGSLKIEKVQIAALLNKIRN